MQTPTANPRGAEFWNSTMGHSWVSQQAVISDVFTSVTSVSLGAAAAKRGERVIDGVGLAEHPVRPADRDAGDAFVEADEVGD